MTVHPLEQDWWARASAVLPGGVNSNTRLLGPEIVITRGSGARLWDSNGNEYIDCLLGQGPAFLGHGAARVREAVIEATKDGVLFAATHPREVEAAERLLVALKWPEMVRFGSSSTEMVQAALRLARAGTGRRRVVLFEGHYHGWLDNVHMTRTSAAPAPMSAGQPQEALDDAILIDWNDPAALDRVFADHGPEIAAVIMEPTMVNAGVIRPLPGYLEQARALTTKHDAVLIFDETITGFRLSLGGASELFEVVPDLAVYGKALAAGWPAAAVVGPSSLMSNFGTGRVGHFGTFNGNIVAMAAVIAGLDILVNESPYAAIEAEGTRLMAGLRELALEYDISLHLQGYPMAFHMSMPSRSRNIQTFRQLQTTDRTQYAELWQSFLGHGIWIAKRGIWYLSAAHTSDVIDELLQRSEESMRSYRALSTASIAVGR